MIHRGSCHCGAVAFEVDAPHPFLAQRCNCSICTKAGFLHLICLDPVPTDMVVEPFDGRNWEANAHSLAYLSKENP